MEKSDLELTRDHLNELVVRMAGWLADGIPTESLQFQMAEVVVAGLQKSIAELEQPQLTHRGVNYAIMSGRA